MNLPIQNLTLRVLNVQDSSHFFDLIDRNRQYLTDYFPQTIATIIHQEACAVYMVKKMKEAADKQGFGFVLEDGQGALQGYISIKNIDWTIPKCELAYFIDFEHKGKGIMSQAIGAIIAHCFDELGMNKVFLITAVDNFSSRKMAEKNGFEVEGILRNNFKLASGVLVDMAYYGILTKRNN